MLPISVNGNSFSVDADRETPLLWVLRDHLDMTGTKFGCGVSLCGACTVFVDGKPVRSCVTPVSSVVGRRVTTIEGVGALRVGKAVQEECIEINRLENAADELVRRLVTNLFESGMDAISVIKHKEIYEFLETATDRCEDVADVLQTVSVKNS